MQLVITEKPRAAIKIAEALAESKVQKRSVSGVPYYEFTRDGKKIVVACAVGHLFGIAEKVKSSKYPVEELEWKPKESFAKKYASVLKNLASSAEDFIIACDYDIEGEIIGLNVLRFLCNQQDAKRMKFSTLTKEELEKAYEKAASHIDWGQAIAGETRHHLDFMYGISLSRALMQAIKKGGTYKKLSIGRVQGPTLALLVKREKAIAKFKSEFYWQVFLLVKDDGKEILVAYPKNILKEAEAQEFQKLKGKYGDAITTKEEARVSPPAPFDLTTLQVEAFKHLGLTPSQTLQIAQTLYLEGLISYPRTASQKLPAAIGYRAILQKLAKQFPELAKHAKRSGPIEGEKTDPAHPAIFPTGERADKLTAVERAVYELITRRFLACFAEDAVIENKVIKVTVEGKEFFAKGLQIREKGWLNVYKAKYTESEVPDLKGKVFVEEVKIEQKETQPPKRYTAASVVSVLTKRKLGTKGTRATIIDTLYERGYIKDRSIVVTPLGISVEEALQKYCPLILDEKLTRSYEDKMEKIQTEKHPESAKTEEEKIVKESREVLEKISQQFKKNEEKIGEELVKAYKTTREKERDAQILNSCECGGNLIVRVSKKTKKRFVACSRYPECTITFPLPQKGYLQKAEQQCKKCGRNMITLLQKGKRPWTICFAGCGV